MSLNRWITYDQYNYQEYNLERYSVWILHTLFGSIGSTNNISNYLFILVLDGINSK